MITIEFTYTNEDFSTPAPYEYISQIADPFQRGIAERELGEYAKTVGFRTFKTALRQYRESLRAAAQVQTQEAITQFDEQQQELITGEWTADDSGVWRYGSGGTEIACTHPIVPVRRLRNIDTGELKIALAFRRGSGGRRTWNEIITDFDTVSNAKNIVQLARIGVSVTSGKRAQNLVDYLADVMDLNYDTIPEIKSVSRMGWNEEGFSPYVDGVVYDGSAGFERLFRAISPVGELEPWLQEARAARQYSVTAKILLAASFASVLVGPLGSLPFFVHLWGMDSATGKTVGQMLAAAVWGNPAVGSPFFPTFKATSVGFEVIAGFLNSLPVFVDELHLAKDARGKLIFNVYELASGTGKLRSNKALGLATTPSWANCFITSGESPMVGETDGAGALNRVIEIECKADAKVIENGHRTSGVVKCNYGHAGKIFIEKMIEPGVREIVDEIYSTCYEQCMANNTTEKQAMAAALIVTADIMATTWIYQDDSALTVTEIAEFLKSKEAVSAAERGYNFICDWVTQNANNLKENNEAGETYGVLGTGDEFDYVFIIRSVFNRVCAENGISAPALLSHLKSRGLIKTRGKALTKNKRIKGIATECVALMLRDISEPLDDGEQIPF